MALRRPPTAISLKPADVTDLQTFLAERDAKPTVVGKNEEQPGRDGLVEREKREREDREGRGMRGRVMGQ
ncbi:hypothetical protein JCM21900_005203 [Sporobolomyces salmonicolor]